MFYFSTTSCGKAGLAPAFFALRALRAHLRAPHRSACLSELDVLLRLAPFNAPLCSATATVFIIRAGAVCVRSPRVLSSLPAFPLALRSRAHLRRLRYSGHAPSACLASLGITTKTIFCIISSLRMWKRGFPTISAQKLQASRARAVRAPLPVQKSKFLYNSLAP